MVKTMQNQQMVRGELVRLARQARKLTQTELAEKAGITQAYVSMIEDGVRLPGDEQLRKLAITLDFPERFFSRDDFVLGPSVGEVFHRRRKQIPKKELEEFYAWVNIDTFIARQLLSGVNWPDVLLPELTLDVDVATEEDAAQFLRSRWYVPKGPISNVSNLLARAGVLVVSQKVSVPEIDGMSYWLSDLPPLIAVNTSVTQDRLRFTLMHEVAHLILHHRSQIRTFGPSIEDEANRMASAFLMPSSEIRHQLSHLTLAKLADLKQHWRVSMAALIMRARQLETITPSEEKRLWIELSQMGWRKREPAQLDVTGEQPTGLYEDLICLYRERGYDDVRMASLLGLSRLNVAELLGSGHSHLRVI